MQWFKGPNTHKAGSEHGGSASHDHEQGRVINPAEEEGGQSRFEEVDESCSSQVEVDASND